MTLANNHNWLPVVEEQVKTLRFGVVQIVVHDSKVVQVERTERTRFDNGSSNKEQEANLREAKK